VAEIFIGPLMVKVEPVTGVMVTLVAATSVYPDKSSAGGGPVVPANAVWRSPEALDTLALVDGPLPDPPGKPVIDLIPHAQALSSPVSEQ